MTSSLAACSQRISAGARDIDRLRRFLDAYWLRPENALWMALRSRTLEAVPFSAPAIDIACGDGIFTFLHLGGTFDPAFDVFVDVQDVKPSATERADMFNHVSPRYEPLVVCAPAQTVEHGLDLKPALLERARRLGLYAKLTCHDSNKPLPLPPERFETAYCNAAYWVRNIDGFLREVSRITRAGGSIVLQVKLAALARYTLKAHGARLTNEFLNLIEGGRIQSWPSLATRSEWEKRFARAGLKIVQEIPFITRTHAHIWDIGLRPVAPLLVRMANRLSPESRTEIKKEWVELLTKLLGPFCLPDFDLFDRPDEPAEIQYILSTC